LDVFPPAPEKHLVNRLRSAGKADRTLTKDVITGTAG
jgi:hypothetical protein